MKKFHIAISAANLNDTIADYSKRLGQKPDVVIPGQYALWRTEILNLSIREEPHKTGQLRHIGFEDSAAPEFTKSVDVNGISWENFAANQQADEINNLWPKAKYKAKK